MMTCHCRFGSGLKTAHCAADGCHRNFTTPANFDRHRQHGECLAPETVGLVSSRTPWGTVWHQPGREESE